MAQNQPTARAKMQMDVVKIILFLLACASFAGSFCSFPDNALITQIPDNYVALVFCFVFIMVFDILYYNENVVFYRENTGHNYFIIISNVEIVIGALCCACMFFWSAAHYNGNAVAVVALVCSGVIFCLKSLRVIIILHIMNKEKNK